MEIKGIDVSHFNGAIDWKKVKEDGIEFAIVQAGFGSTLENKDPRFDTNVQGALAAGIEVGAYWFSYAYTTSMAQKEADLLMEICAPYKGKMGYPLCFDWEYDSARYAQSMGVEPSNALITDMAIAFLQELEDNDWYAMNYTNLDYYRNKFQMNRLTKYDIWLADYSGGGSGIQCGILQNSDKGSVNGVGSENVDTDIAYKDYPLIMKKAGLNGYKKEDEQEDPEMIYNTVEQVPEWARPTIEKLVEKGYLKGTEDGQLDLNDTMLRLLVINDRAGLYQ